MRNPGALISLARLKTADDYTYMHSVAVCALMVALSRQLGLDAELTRELGMAGLLHDMGKALIPTEVLNKPGKLTDEEFAMIKRHPAEGHRLLVEGATVGDIPLDVALHHHERWDGSGYPHGLARKSIPESARIVALADVYDALVHARVYKPAYSDQQALEIMAAERGRHFDPALFDIFLHVHPEIQKVREASSDNDAVRSIPEASCVSSLRRPESSEGG